MLLCFTDAESGSSVACCLCDQEFLGQISFISHLSQTHFLQLEPRPAAAERSTSSLGQGGFCPSQPIDGHSSCVQHRQIRQESYLTESESILPDSSNVDGQINLKSPSSYMCEALTDTCLNSSGQPGSVGNSFGERNATSKKAALLKKHHVSSAVTESIQDTVVAHAPCTDSCVSPQTPESITHVQSSSVCAHIVSESTAQVARNKKDPSGSDYTLPASSTLPSSDLDSYVLQAVMITEDSTRKSSDVSSSVDKADVSASSTGLVSLGLQSTSTVTAETRACSSGPAVAENPNVKGCNKEKSQSNDFYFLLGTVGIQGASLAYERTDFRCLHCAFSTAWCPSLMKHMNHLHKDALELHDFLDIQNNKAYGKEAKQTKYKNIQVVKLSDYLACSKKSRIRTRKMERQDIPGKYQCPTCQKVFSKLRYLRRHQLTHRTERAHLCDSCGKSFKTRAILVAHRRSHKTKNYHCPQCSFVSCSATAIHTHRQQHPSGSVICDICGTAYINKSTLNKHRRVHDLNRPYPCTYHGCTLRFKTDIMRQAHVRNHSTVRKFHCWFCGYNFRQKHHLQRHITKIHGSLHSALSLTSLPTVQHDESAHSSQTLAPDILSGQLELCVPENGQQLPETVTSCESSLAIQNDADCCEVYVPAASHIICASDTFGVHLAKQEHAVVEVIVEDETQRLQEPHYEEEKLCDSEAALGSLEYFGESDDGVQFLVGKDHDGNLVQYKIAYLKDERELSHSFCLINQDGAVIDVINSQEQSLPINSEV